MFQQKGDNKPIFINFGGFYPDHKFTVVIFADDHAKFPFSIKEKYNNQKVCVIGKIEEYKGKMQMVINSSKSILFN